MEHVVEIFDRRTEELLESIEISTAREAELDFDGMEKP